MESSGSKGRTPPIPQNRPAQRPATGNRPPAPAPPATLSRPVLPKQVITPDTDLLTTARVTAEWAKDKGAYLKMAFKNPYNLSLLAGGLTASVLTLNPLLALATLGLEGIWMLHAPDSGLLRRALWDPRLQKLRQEMEDRERSARLAILSPEARQRVIELVDGQRQIRRLAAQNPSFAGEMLRGELDKTDRLVASFIDLSVTCARYEEYLGSVDERQLAAEKRRLEQVCGVTPGPATAGKATVPASPPEPGAQDDDQQTGIARKNLAIINKRIEKLTEIHRYLAVARGQLDLISNSFQLIADQIVTMQSPQELSGQLDELLDGVESVKQTAVDTEKLLATLGS
ncbi:MAG TPA: hypothetical protein VFE33_03660 [Thermoanaerobaculia bacterium]|nr:hypothetical protein [Thermoanaerobaculia bacterium]